MVVRVWQLSAISFLLVFSSQVRGVAANPSDCGDMSKDATDILAELDKKDSNPSTVQSELSSFVNESKLCLDDKDTDSIPDALESELVAVAKSIDEQFETWAKDSKQWLTDASTLFSWSCKEIKKIEEELCSVDAEPSEQPDIKAAKALSATLERAALDKIKPLLTRFSALAATHKLLVAEPRLKSKVEKQYAPMKKRNANLRGTVRKDILKGARRPFVRFAIDYGIQRHKQMGRGCVIADKQLPNGKTRPDCFMPKACYIIEFKPKGDTTWHAQVRGYQKALTSYYNEKLKGYRLAPERFGDEEEPWWTRVVARKVNTHCTNSSGRVTFRTPLSSTLAVRAHTNAWSDKCAFIVSTALMSANVAPLTSPPSSKPSASNHNWSARAVHDAARSIS